MKKKRSIREVLTGPEAWCKGSARHIVWDGDTPRQVQHCLLNAAEQFPEKTRGRMIHPLANAIRVLYPDRVWYLSYPINPINVLVAFNDSPLTEWADVDRVIKLADV